MALAWFKAASFWMTQGFAAPAGFTKIGTYTFNYKDLPGHTQSLLCIFTQRIKWPLHLPLHGGRVIRSIHQVRKQSKQEAAAPGFSPSVTNRRSIQKL